MILITGGTGFVGLNIARYLAEQGKEVMLCSRHDVTPPSFMAQYWSKQVKYAVGDILDLPFLNDLVKKNKVESIIHAAAVWLGRRDENSLYHVARVNIEGTLNMLEMARIFGLRRVTFISSVGLYYGLSEPWHEDLNYCLPCLDEDLGSTKKAAEHVCSLYIKKCGISVPMIRLARAYGPAARSAWNPMELMIKNAVAGKALDLSHVSGNSYVAPIYVKDAAKGISMVHLAESLRHDVYNLGDGTYQNWFSIAEIVKKLIPSAEIRLGTGEPAVQYFQMPINRISEELGYQPSYDVNQGTQAYIDWLREEKY